MTQPVIPIEPTPVPAPTPTPAPVVSGLPALGAIVLYTLPSGEQRPAIVTKVHPAQVETPQKNAYPASVDLFVFTSPEDGEEYATVCMRARKVFADNSRDAKIKTVNTFRTTLTVVPTTTLAPAPTPENYRPAVSATG